MRKKKAARESIGIYYRANVSWQPSIRSAKFVSITDLTITYLERTGWDGKGEYREFRENLSSPDHKWFPSFKEAKEFVVRRFDERLERAQRDADAARNLKEPEKAE